MPDDTRLSEFFTIAEAKCPCCGTLDVGNAIKLANKLDRARALVGPIIVNSWHRCPVRNRKKGGVQNSAHLRSLAVDIRVFSGHHRLQLLSALLAADFHRIGIGDAIIHADIDPTLPAETCWTYYPQVSKDALPAEPL